METPKVYNMNERPWYEFKKHPFIVMGDDPIGVFSQFVEGELHVEYIRAYIHCKFGSVGDKDNYSDIDEVYDNEKKSKLGFKFLGDLNILQFMSYGEFWWTRVVYDSFE